ncbi:MAG: hypothetical protein HXY38_11420 [Chloroflexi bacterium]|nr:hypothetical protein [Chloroflexota bacterium]
MSFRKFRWLAVAILAAILVSSCNLGATPPPTVDANAIQTQAFGQVLTQVADQSTQTAAAMPPTPLPTFTLAPTNTLPAIPTSNAFGIATNTPFAFNTQQPGLTPQALVSPTVGAINTVTTLNGCNDGRYEGETGPADKSTVERGKEFSKGWTIHNTGECTWDEGYIFDYLQDYFPDVGINQLDGYDVRLKKNTPEEYTKPGYGQTFIVKLRAPTTPGEYKAYWKLRDDAGNYFGPLVYVWIIVP